MTERTHNTNKTDDKENDERQREGAAMVYGRKNNSKDKVKESTKERRRKSRDVEIPDDGVPYDRGWAWMIVLAGFLNFVISAGYNRATFIFFVNFLEEFNAPVSQTALLFGVKETINSVGSLFIMNAVVGRFGVRKTVFVGGACISLSAILGSFANDVTSLILSQAVFHGLGMSMINMPATVLIGFYFKRRRSLANSITKCGVGVGAVAFPPMATYLLDQFGLRGALLLMGAICLNSLVAALLLRPTSFFKKRKTQNSDGDASEHLLGDDSAADRADHKADTTGDVFPGRNCESGTNADVDEERNHHFQTRNNDNSVSDRDSEYAGDGCVVVIGQPLVCSAIKAQEQLAALSSHDHEEVADLSKSTPVLNTLTTAKDRFRRRTSSFSGNEVMIVSKNISRTIRPRHPVLDLLSQSSVVRYISSPDLHLDTPCVLTDTNHHNHHTQHPEESSKRPPPSRTCLGKVCHVAGKVVRLLDFRLFRSPMFRLLVVFFVTSSLVNAIPVYLPAMAAERGLDRQQRALLISIIGALDFCCRLICGFTADLKIIKVSTMIGIAFIILGVVCQLTRFMTSFSLLIGLSVAHGLMGGVSACMMPVLIMEDIGVENTAKALGFERLFSGAALAAFHPLLGYIRDNTGSYDAAYNLIGAFTLLSAVIMLCLHFLPHTTSPSRDLYVICELEESSPLGQNTDNGSRQLSKLP